MLYLATLTQSNRKCPATGNQDSVTAT